MKSEELLIRLLDNRIFGKELIKNLDDDLDISSLIRLARQHDLAHLIYDALVYKTLLPKDSKDDYKLKKIKYSAVCREVQADSIIEIIRKVFSDGGIDFIFLKGALIKKLYPEPWMRTSCDIDVLVKDTELDKAVDLLKNNGFATDDVKNYHDVSLFYGNVHVELHHSILENLPYVDDILDKVWENSVVKNGSEYELLPEFFVFHHVAHMAYHFLSGGCGIRPFIDLRLMKNKGFYEESKLTDLLKRCDLLQFYEGVCEILAVWFDGKEKNQNVRIIEEYVFSGGVYGNKKNTAKIGTVKHNGRLKYLFSLAFLPYKSMCILYPSLKKHKLLLPFCYIHRFFSKTFGKDRKKVKGVTENIFSLNTCELNTVSGMLKYLGLKTVKENKAKQKK